MRNPPNNHRLRYDFRMKLKETASDKLADIVTQILTCVFFKGAIL